MAKQEIKYICEICGAKYPKEDMAEGCERKHFKATKISKANYELSDNKNEYPTSLLVVVKNGEGVEKSITYKRG